MIWYSEHFRGQKYEQEMQLDIAEKVGAKRKDIISPRRSRYH